MQSTPRPAPVSQALVLGFRVLQAFTAAEPALTLAQVADRAGLDSETAFHFVQTLVVLGYVERVAGSKQFRLTLKPLELGFRALAHNLETLSARLGIDKPTTNMKICSLSELPDARRSHSEPVDKLK